MGNRARKGLRKLPALAAVLLALGIAAAPARAMLADTSLPKLRARAERIGVGRVTRIDHIPTGPETPDGPAPTLRVAEIEMLSAWFDCARGDRFRVVAEPSWICDDTTAVLGERALFFLRRREPPSPASREFREAWRKLAGEAPLHEICWSGHGRMPLSRFGGVNHCEVDAYVVKLPPDLPTIPGPNPAWADMIRLVPLPAMRAFVDHRRAADTAADALADDATGRLLRVLRRQSEPEDAAWAERSEVDPETLLRILDTPGHPLADIAAEALVWVGGGARPDPLYKALRAEDPARRRGAARALRWLATLEWDSPFDDALPALREAMADPDPEIRACLVAAIAATDEEEALEDVVRALVDESPLVRRSAARWLRPLSWAIDEGGPSRKIERALLAVATSDDLGARRAAWEALDLVAGDGTLAAARAAFEDEDPIVRQAATRSLGRIRSDEAREVLVARLRGAGPRSRRAAALALGEGGHDRATPDLIAALADPDRWVRLLAIDALGSIGPGAAEAVPALTRIAGSGTDPDERGRARAALDSIRGE